MANHLGELNPLRFAEENLLASPGALAVKDGKLIRIRTIVPARNKEGWCKFFDGRYCTIHPVAPFGCAFFDHHQDPRESEFISKLGLTRVAAIWKEKPRSLYSRIWQYLHDLGLISPAPEESRNLMLNAVGFYHLHKRNYIHAQNLGQKTDRRDIRGLEPPV
jgi:hypothetical protein